ncbi:hypothetical protein YC2023_072022 [Brassica napus]
MDQGHEDTMMGSHPGGCVTACSVGCSILEYLMEMMVTSRWETFTLGREGTALASVQSKSLNEDPLEGKSGASSRGNSSSNSDFDPIVLAFGIGVMINRDSRGHSYFIVRGEILGFMKDEQLRKHLPRMFSLIKNESWGLEDDQIPS